MIDSAGERQYIIVLSRKSYKVTGEKAAHTWRVYLMILF